MLLHVSSLFPPDFVEGILIITVEIRDLSHGITSLISKKKKKIGTIYTLPLI
jgi:hypothetical protein